MFLWCLFFPVKKSKYKFRFSLLLIYFKMKVTSIKRIIFKFRYSKFRIFRKLVSIFVFAILAFCFVIVNVLNRFICQTEDCKSETVIETDLKPHIKSTDNVILFSCLVIWPLNGRSYDRMKFGRIAFFIKCCYSQSFYWN